MNERELKLNSVLYLNRMTHDDKIEWKRSDSEIYLFEASVEDWNLFIGEQATKNSIDRRLSNDYFLFVNDKDEENFIRLTDVSAIDDLVRSVKRQLNLHSVSDKDLLENLVEDLDKLTDYDVPSL